MATTIKRCTVPGCTNPIPLGSRADKDHCDDPECITERNRLRKAASRAKQGSPSKKAPPKPDWHERVDSVSEFETSEWREKRRSRIRDEVGKKAPPVPPRTDLAGEPVIRDPWMDVNHYHATYGMGGVLNPELPINPHEEIPSDDGSAEHAEWAERRWRTTRSLEPTATAKLAEDELGEITAVADIADYLGHGEDPGDQMSLSELMAA